MYNKLKNIKTNRGFTLIEIMLVIVIIAVLAITLIPKISNFTVKANETGIDNDFRSYQLAMEYLDTTRVPISSDPDTLMAQLNQQLDTRVQFIKNGDDIISKQKDPFGGNYKLLVSEEDDGSVSIEIKFTVADSTRGFRFDLNTGKKQVLSNGEYALVFNSNKMFTGSNENNNGGGQSLPIIEPGVLADEDSVSETGELVPAGYTLATDADFTGETDGTFKYIGSGEYVVIPHIIKGVPVTSYSNMFEYTSVKGVASNNVNVTDMGFMFQRSVATNLDLSNFDTSSVTNMSGVFAFSAATTLDLSNFNTTSVTDMSYMFYGSEATSIDLSSFNTISVTNMYAMFYGSEATSIDLSNFNTTSVTSMESMFANSKATILDLSSFDTTSVTNMSYMFYLSKATTGYARIQEDADRFNGTSNKPTDLEFIF